MELIKLRTNFCVSMIGRRTATSSQKSSRISCAAIIFSSRTMCSTYSHNSKPISPDRKSPTGRSPHPSRNQIDPQSNPSKSPRHERKRENPYPDSRGGFLPRLEELGDVFPHLAQLQLPPVPQQLYPRDRQLQQRLAVHRINRNNIKLNTRRTKTGTRAAQSTGREGGRDRARAYHLAPRKPPPPLLKKASSIDMASYRSVGASGRGRKRLLGRQSRRGISIYLGRKKKKGEQL